MKFTCSSIVITMMVVFLAIRPLCAGAIEITMSSSDAITKVGINGNNIAFSTNQSVGNAFEHVFSMKSMSLVDDSLLKNLGFNVVETAWNEYSVNVPMGMGDNSKLELRHLGALVSVIDWKDQPGKRHVTFGFIRGGFLVSGGENGALAVYNKMAEKVATLEGHTGTVTAVAFDGKWLLSGDSSGRMNLWDTDDFVKRGKTKSHPYLSLSYSKTGEWAIWTAEGIYAASANGASLVRFFTVKARSQKVKEQYCRPDLLSMKISSPKKYYMLLSQKFRGRDIELPVVSVVDLPKISRKRDIDLTIRICDTGGGIESAILSLRGTNIDITEASRGISLKEKETDTTGCAIYTRPISLEKGKNEIVLKAFNQVGFESLPYKNSITYESGRRKSSKLHIAAIAVTTYQEKKFGLKYPVEDAKAIINAFKELGYGEFESVVSYSLYDDNAKKHNLDKFFSKLAKEIAPDDVFILFLAGHGIYLDDTSEYYFLPYDVKADTTKNLIKTSLSTSELMKYLEKIAPSQTLLLIDTCQSGGFDGIIRNSGHVTAMQLDLIHRLGRASLMASSKEQVAFEGYRNHGVFTSIVLEALHGGADYTRSDSITVDELSVYVSKHLPELTERKWGYRQEAIRNTTGHDFILGRNMDVSDNY